MNFFADLIVNAGVELVLVDHAVAAAGKVVGCAVRRTGLIRGRQQGQQRERLGGQQIIGNEVLRRMAISSAGRVDAAWIVDLPVHWPLGGCCPRGTHAQIAPAPREAGESVHQFGGNCAESRSADPLADALVIPKSKDLILLDGTAEGAAELTV